MLVAQIMLRSYDVVSWLGVLVGNQVVMRVTVIGDEGATMVVAGNFEHISVDFAHRGFVGLAIDLNGDGVVGESSGCELSVDLGVNLNVTSVDLELHTVGAEGLVVMCFDGMGFFLLIGNQVVMRVSIIGDEDATMVVAGNFEHVGVDFAHGGLVGLAVDLNCDGVVGKGSGCELCVDLGVHLNVASVDLELHTVGAEGLVVV